ncbi:transcription elongation factor TFIIS-like [Alnus glutinosa]|uniref:transcription elongation factor TFIIS-like n=1 Tax=Alnus glutinosa TaxID=3517 RepID=UPI002D772104|nr:transcription elongation factor TFIIS-like [Alnus glutinosa]
MVKVEPSRNEMSGSLGRSSGVTKKVIILKSHRPDVAMKAFSRVAIEADEGGIKPDVTACDPVGAAALVESAMFEKIGWSNGIKKAKYRSVLFNLKDPENPDLRRKVLLGQILPEVLVTMSAEQMASHKRQRENIQIQLKSLNKRN